MRPGNGAGWIWKNPEITGRKFLGGLAIHPVGWCDVEHRASRHGLGMIEHHELQNTRSTVMSHCLEAVKTQSLA